MFTWLTCASARSSAQCWAVQAALLEAPIRQGCRLGIRRCKCRLGSFNWSGMRSAGGQWVTPAFQLHGNNVDSEAAGCLGALAGLKISQPRTPRTPAPAAPPAPALQPTMPSTAHPVSSAQAGESAQARALRLASSVPSALLPAFLQTGFRPARFRIPAHALVHLILGSLTHQQKSVIRVQLCSCCGNASLYVLEPRATLSSVTGCS